MRFLLLLALLSSLAQAQTRPQLSDADAGKFQLADYLGDWQPAALNAAGWRADFTVAADGSGTHRTLQAALDAVPATGKRVYILVKPGTYREQICVKAKAPFTLYGSAADAAAVVIVNGHYNAELKGGNPCVADAKATIVGTAGSASVALFSNDIQLVNLTIANDALNAVRGGVGYPAGVGESGGAQAVALMTEGDRLQFENVRLLGHQDTFYARAGRVYVHASLIAGDVDFIFGDARLVIADSTLLNRAGRRTPGSGGHVLAPSTPADQRLGFLVTGSSFIAEPGVLPASISLGRAWDFGIAAGIWVPGISPNGQALVRDSVIGPHIGPYLGPWAASTSRRAFSAAGNRLAEYRNSAPDISREALAATDGWAAAEGGTRGGADAAPADVFEVRSRAELLAAFAAAGNRPKIVKVMAHIDLSAGAVNYADPAYDFEAFLLAYDPATWGRKPIEGPLEDARRRSAKAQAAQVVVKVPSNTSVLGVGPEAGFEGGMLYLEKVNNIIIRDLHFSDAFDLFPAWDPNDNGHGEWNSEYDTVSLRGATHVWVDHCTFDDGARPDLGERIAFGQRIQRHDGLLDITQQSNFVTVSWNVFRQHDKTTLVGSSDGQVLDQGKLKITFHHNLWEQVKERTPRVRYGEVHVYNNLFVARSDGPYAYGYSLGVGAKSHVFSERNVWETSADIGADRLIRVLKGTAFADRDSLLNGRPVDVLAAWRAAHPGVEIAGDVGWTPTLFAPMDAAADVAARVRAGAGKR